MTALVCTVLVVVRPLELVVVVELELLGVVALLSMEVKMTFTLKAILLVDDVATKSKY